MHTQLTAIFTGVASTPSQHDFPYLTMLVLVPALAGLLVLMIPRGANIAIRSIGVLTSVGVLGIAAAVVAEFSTNTGGMQMTSVHPWIAPLGISWSLGVDGISLFLVLMSALLFPLALLGAGA